MQPAQICNISTARVWGIITNGRIWRPTSEKSSAGGIT
jgi:hypothetical protein